MEYQTKLIAERPRLDVQFYDHSNRDFGDVVLSLEDYKKSGHIKDLLWEVSIDGLTLTFTIVWASKEKHNEHEKMMLTKNSESNGFIESWLHYTKNFEEDQQDPNSYYNKNDIHITIVYPDGKTKKLI